MYYFGFDQAQLNNLKNLLNSYRIPSCDIKEAKIMIGVIESILATLENPVPVENQKTQ